MAFNINLSFFFRCVILQSDRIQEIRQSENPGPLCAGCGLMIGETGVGHREEKKVEAEKRVERREELRRRMMGRK